MKEDRDGPDHAASEKIFKLFRKLKKKSDGMPQYLWVSACWTFLSELYLENGISYEQFKEQTDGAMAHIKDIYLKHPKEDE